MPPPHCASDASTIVRDYAVDAVGAYAGTSRAAAEAAYPILQAALAAWGGKHAARALQGLAQVAAAAPELRGRVGDAAGRRLPGAPSRGCAEGG
jgi:hypothetical protein